MIEIVNVRPIKERRHGREIHVKNFNTMEFIFAAVKNLDDSSLIRRNVRNEYIKDYKGRYTINIRCTETDFKPIIDKFNLKEAGSYYGRKAYVLKSEED